MHEVKNKIALQAMGLLVVLSVIGGLDGVAAAADESTTTTEPTTTEATTPPTTEAPPTSEAPATTQAPATTVAPAPSSSEATTSEAAPRTTTRGRGPDPRWIDYGNCGSGYTACHVAKAHQRDGKFQWRHGRWFRWGDERVRGHRGETWAAFQQEARRVRAYVVAVAISRQRAALVNRWSGVAHCESGGNWSIATGNGYYGGLQFNLGTWQAYGGQGMPNQRPAWYQATIAERVRTDSGLGHWPHCGSYYG